MTHGVIFGFEPAGRICGNSRMYYFGRSKQTVLQDVQLLDDEVKQRDMLIRRLKFSGLNRPKKMLFWLKVDGDLDVGAMWDEIKDRLRWNRGRTGPSITNEFRFGDNWFSTDMQPEPFAEWCKTMVQEEVQLILQRVPYRSQMDVVHRAISDVDEMLAKMKTNVD